MVITVHKIYHILVVFENHRFQCIIQFLYLYKFLNLLHSVVLNYVLSLSDFTNLHAETVLIFFERTMRLLLVSKMYILHPANENTEFTSRFYATIEGFFFNILYLQIQNLHQLKSTFPILAFSFLRASGI